MTAFSLGTHFPKGCMTSSRKKKEDLAEKIEGKVLQKTKEHAVKKIFFQIRKAKCRAESKTEKADEDKNSDKKKRGGGEKSRGRKAPYSALGRCESK